MAGRVTASLNAYEFRCFFITAAAVRGSAGPATAGEAARRVTRSVSTCGTSDPEAPRLRGLSFDGGQGIALPRGVTGSTPDSGSGNPRPNRGGAVGCATLEHLQVGVAGV